MIELAFLAFMTRLMNWGLTPLITTRTVAADTGTVHRFLSEPANELRLLGNVPRGFEVHVRPRASGRVLSAEIVRGRRSLLRGTWILSAGRGTTEVDLVVQFETRGLATRLALVLGGRRWLARRVDAALARLGGVCARAAEELVPAPEPAPVSARAAADCSRRTRKTRSARDAKRAASRTS